MFRISLIIIFVLIFSACTTTRVITTDKQTNIRDIEVKSDTSGFQTIVDLNELETWKPDKSLLKPEIVDTQKVIVKIPKKVIFKAKKQTVKLNDKTKVDVEISAVMDSGKVDLKTNITRVAYQESTVVEKIEKDTTSKSTTRIMIITVLAFIAIIVVAFLRK